MVTLRPLLKCCKLVYLELVHHCPLSLHHADIEELASSWPGAETLLLNCEPAYLTYTQLTLKALEPYARYCPKLHTLGLYIDATIPSFSDDAPPPDGSIITDEGPVALYLSQLFPLECQIEAGEMWDDTHPIAESNAQTIEARCELWQRVGKLLPLMMSVRTQERRRVRELEEEVEDLRTRADALVGELALRKGMDVRT
ncbi:hypothetical protein H0H81_006762 [Sphagnurus paluster]|uniref:Uncharacterized protein n=1 Tax=Sphagnurus paluster TaxID=117069 RepID=A0A9P7FT56_9AGAR|nr:hypothetical protein H0H81_006762 [Sphagnurus paluster]